MDVENARAVPLTQGSDTSSIPLHRTDDPEYFWFALVVLLILSIVIIVLLYMHDSYDPGYSK